MRLFQYADFTSPSFFLVYTNIHKKAHTHTLALSRRIELSVSQLRPNALLRITPLFTHLPPFFWIVYIYALALIVNSRASFSRRIGRVARDDYSQTCAQKERENYGSRTDEAAAAATSRISSASLLARVRSFCRSSPSFSLFFSL